MADTGLLALYTTQFSTNLELLLQQRSSVLRGRIREGFHVGKMASPINYGNALKMKSPAGRFAPISRDEIDYQRRWVFPQDGEVSTLVDTFDELRSAVSVQSTHMAAINSAAGRYYDDIIINAATANATTGQDASALATESFDTAKFQIAVNFGASGNTGLTVAKLIEARRIFKKFQNEFSASDPTLIIGSTQDADLLSQVQVVSTEFSEAPVLKDGKVERFLGFTIVESQRLPETTAGSVRGVLAILRDGMYLGVWRDLNTDISQRKDLSGLPWQMYANVTMGATRLQPGKVIQILCADTAGADITP